MWPSDPHATDQLVKFGHGQKVKFRDFEFKSDTAVLNFSFFLPSSFSFLALFFSLAGNSAGFILVGKVLRKAVRILGLDEKVGG